MQDLKVEVPLSPRHTDQPPPWKSKSVSFREVLSEVIPDFPSLLPAPEGISSDEIDAFFDLIEPIAVQAERSIEQEQLQEADTVGRVAVPIMDFSRPKAPWSVTTVGGSNTKETYQEMLAGIKNLHFKNQTWPVGGKVERELQWMPFPPALAKFETHESIDDDGSASRFLDRPECIDTETLTWKPEGLRIFDELADSDEEELEEGKFPDGNDIRSLIRKRKLELEYDNEFAGSNAKTRADCSSHVEIFTSLIETWGPPDGTSEIPFPKQAPSRDNAQRYQIALARPNFQESSFSAIDALGRYMSVRGGSLEHRKSSAKIGNSEQVELMPDPFTKEYDTNFAFPNAQHVQPAGPAPLPHPPLEIPTDPRSFVVSTSFLSNRRLSRLVLKLYPSAEIIERDRQLPPKLEPAPMHESPETMSEEADITASPGTGFIWTTLQKAMQRSLPGQVSRSALRERITRIAQRYERLLVLLSEDRQSSDCSIARLSDSDYEVITELTAFCSSLQDDVQVTFVAGGEEDLARWIVAMMIKHSIVDQEIELPQEETPWESFLRRAGLNAVAAQTVLAVLALYGGNGLTTFVKMSLEQRLAMFEMVFGGRRLLGRVSEVIDSSWQD